jgi:hypothetical protein
MDMKQAYASLHTAEPGSQSDNEVSYKGYRRMAIQYHEHFGDEPTEILFPEIEEDAEGEIKYIAFGDNESGDGSVQLVVHSMPYIKLTKTVDGNAPRIIVTNISPDNLPANVNPIARVAHNLWVEGKLKPEELHPKLYEAINDALHNAGVPVIPVTRAGDANMVQTTGWGLEDLGKPN